MSRRRSTSSAMGPPPDRDVVMGPPPVPAPSPSSQKGKEAQDITEKYRKLKRRFFELEEKHKETSTELQRSGERNVKMREERNILLDRIIELEDSQPKSNGSSSVSPPHSGALAQPSSSAFPRTLLNARARTSFIANLRQANAEDDADDDLDPVLTSRHAGPEARRRSDEERRERLEEEVREHRKSTRKTRASHPQAGSSHKGKESSIGMQDDYSLQATGKQRRQSSGHTSLQPDRLTPPSSHNTSASSSSSRSHSHQLPLPSTQPHPHSYTHPLPPSPSHLQQTHQPSGSHHYPHHRQNSLTPEQDGYSPPSPGSGMDVDMTDDRGNYNHSPPPTTQSSLRNLDNVSEQDHDYRERDNDQRNNGNAEPNTAVDSPTFPLRSETSSPPASTSRIASGSAPSRRESSRTRRAGKTSVINNATPSRRSRGGQESEYRQEHEHSYQTRGSTKRGVTSPAVSARLTRSESAALAKAEAEAKAQAEAEGIEEEYKAQVKVEHIPRTPSSSRESVLSPPVPSPAPSATVRDPTPISPTTPIHGGASEDIQMNETPSAPVQQATTITPEPPRVHSPTPPIVASSVVQDAPPMAALQPPPARTTSSPPTPQNDTPIDPAILSTSAQQKSEAKVSSKEPSPMENIVKVAEAAVAAQNAANAAQNTIPTPAPSVSPTPGQAQTPGSSSSTTSTTTSTSPTTPQLSTNPYMITTNLGISTAVKPSINTMGPGMPTYPGMHLGHPLAMNPYAMYYPPGTPVTPNTPTYAHPYANPYYYMGTPMAGPSGLYPTSPSFVPPSAQRPPSEVQRQAKPKRLKAHTVTSKSFSIPMVPRDKRGKPMLPLNVGIMTVINLGDVCMREHFHTERYIFPVGYEVTRRYLSTIDPSVEVVYHCTILDGGDGPKFQIVPSDVPDRPVIAGTATGAWSNIVKQANAIRNRQHSNSVSGPDFFGLGQNTIKHLIQELPNADRLRDYVWQNFIEGGPLGGRHAAVIPALPEEYDASMPIGAYYPSEREKMKREASANPESPRGISHYPQHIVAQAEAQRQQQASTQAQQQNPPGRQSSPQQQQHRNSQQPTQITLPSPSSSESLSFQAYQHPGGQPRNASASSTGNDSASAQKSRSPSVQPHYSRSSSGSQPSSQGLHHSPYLPGSNAPPSSASPPAVPATFASIMNAYPAPGQNEKQ